MTKLSLGKTVKHNLKMWQKAWFIMPVTNYSNDLEINCFNHMGRVQLHSVVVQKDINRNGNGINLGEFEEISG